MFTGTLLVSASTALAQQPRLPVTRLAADMVWVKKGPKLYGALESRDEAGNVRLIVDRGWLATTAPDFYATAISRDKEAVDASRARLRERIAAWRTEREDDPGIRIFLDSELERLRARDTKPGDGAPETSAEPSGLMVIEVLSDEVHKAYAQPALRRKLMLAALGRGLERAVTRTPQALQRELEAMEVDWRNEPLPAAWEAGTVNDNDQQWAARVAMVEYRRRQSLNFQGSGTFIARTGKGADKKPLEEVMSRVMQDQLSELINRAIGGGALKREDDGKWLLQAISVAEKEKYRGFRVARLHKDIERGSVRVTIGFYAQMPDRKWRLVFETIAAKLTSEVKPESIEEISAAEDVKKITNMLAAVVGEGGGAIRKALGFGAAAKEAMDKAHLDFTVNLNRLTKRIDEPKFSLAR